MRFRFLFLGALLTTAGAVPATELLVSNYIGDSVARFDLNGGGFLGNFSGGSLDGTLATRVGPNGMLYVCSELNNSIQRFSLTTHTYQDTIASGVGLNGPTGLAFDSNGNMLVGNFNNSTVTKFSPGGTLTGTLVASGANGLNGPDIGITIGPDGKLYVPSFNNNAILMFDPTNGGFLGTFANAATGLTQPRTILFRDNKIWVTSDNGNKVLRYNPDGTLFDTFVTAGSGGLSGASGMAFGEDGFLYVSSWRNNQVLKYSMNDGSFAGVFASGANLNGPVSLTVVPEPASIAVCLAGLTGMILRRRKPIP
jgi:streptogramin lyase